MTALDDALAVLACPVCLLPLHRDRGLACDAGHAFDVARQGYAALAVGAAVPGDTAAMVRDRAGFLAGGHFDRVSDAIAATVPEEAGWVADLAGGTGHHLARVLDARPAARGIGLDASAPATRLAARVHPRAAAATADLRTRIPLRDASVDRAMIVFGPRNGPELARILRPGGTATVVVPEPEHLAELRGPFGTLAVAADKDRRLRDRMRPLRPVEEQRIAYRRLLPPEDVARAVLMGPSGHHLDREDVERTARDLGEVEVAVAVRVAVFR